MSTRSKVAYWIAGIAGALVLAAMMLMSYGLSKAFPPPAKGTPDPPLNHVLWPDPATARVSTSASEVARELVTDFIGVRRPALGRFAPAEGFADNGEVPVYSRGHIDLRVHAAFDPEPLGERSVPAGAAHRAPFSGVVAFTPPAGTAAVIVARAGDAFAARRMSFAEPGQH
jgi:hypothetical protein